MTRPALLLLSLTALLSAAAPPPTLAGRWSESERGLEVEFSTDGGVWSATAVQARHAEDLGREVLRDLRWSDAEGQFRGTLFKPDDDARAACALTPRGDRLEVKVRAFIFSKTITLERVVTDAGSPAARRR